VRYHCIFVSVRGEVGEKWSDEKALTLVHSCTLTNRVYTVRFKTGSFGKEEDGNLLPLFAKCNPKHMRAAVGEGEEAFGTWSQSLFAATTNHDKVIKPSTVL
jgi:hypothetical protein